MSKPCDYCGREIEFLKVKIKRSKWSKLKLFTWKPMDVVAGVDHRNLCLTKEKAWKQINPS